MNYPPTGVKKTLTKFGYIEINKQHRFSNGINNFQISPLLQELMVYFGQMECYEKCPEMIKKAIAIEVGHSQVHRVVDLYGKELEKTIATTRTLPPLKSEEVLYCERLYFTLEKKAKNLNYLVQKEKIF